MNCPHCGKGPYNDWFLQILPSDPKIGNQDVRFPIKDKNDNIFRILYQKCQHCSNMIIVVQIDSFHKNKDEYISQIINMENINNTIKNVTRYSVEKTEGIQNIVAYPEYTNSTDLSNEIPEIYRSLYRRAETIINKDAGLAAIGFGILIETIIKKEISNSPKQGTLGTLLRNPIVEQYFDTLDKELHQQLLDVILIGRNLSGHANLDLQTNDLISISINEVEMIRDITYRVLDLAFIQPTKAEIIRQSLAAKNNNKQK